MDYSGVLGGGVATKNERAAEAMQIIEDEFARFAKDGPTDDELEKAKKRFVRSMIFARDEQSGMARIYGSTLTTGGTVEDIESWPDRIRAVSVDQVKAAAVRWLDERRSVAGYLLPKE